MLEIARDGVSLLYSERRPGGRTWAWGWPSNRIRKLAFWLGFAFGYARVVVLGMVDDVRDDVRRARRNGVLR
jgi:hypothetical protein